MRGECKCAVSEGGERAEREQHHLVRILYSIVFHKKVLSKLYEAQ
jgi:hypothetical protein